MPVESSTGTQGPVGGDPRGCLGDSPSLLGRRGNAVSKCSEQRPAGSRACLRACVLGDRRAGDACVVRGGLVCVVRHQLDADHLSKGC